MPELPEVEIMRRYFESAALHKEIGFLEFHDDLFKVFKTPPQALEEGLIGNTFIATERIGKYLFAKLSDSSWLHLHFGMTGDLELFRSQEFPKYTRFVIGFKDGDKLAYKDLRKFGVIELVKSPEDYQKQNKLGIDLLEVNLDTFKMGLASRKVAIKTALLDQKHFAGIGNWIADEMLFNCGIHPEKPANELSQKQYEQLWQEGKDIVKEAIKQDTHYGDFPNHFFVNYRKEGVCHPNHPNSPVQRMVVGGRGTFIVAEKQKLED